MRPKRNKKEQKKFSDELYVLSRKVELQTKTRMDQIDVFDTYSTKDEERFRDWVEKEKRKKRDYHFLRFLEGSE